MRISISAWWKAQRLGPRWASSKSMGGWCRLTREPWCGVLLGRKHGASCGVMAMWFDAKAKLAEIAGHPPATSATNATQPQPASQLSRVSQAPVAEKQHFVAKVASVATPSASRNEPDGETVGGRAVTWTGRVVSLDEWRHLTAWDRKGPDGRPWCGIDRNWKGEGR